MKIVPFFAHGGGVSVEFYHEKDQNRLHVIIHWIVDIIVAITLACYVVYAFGGRMEVNGSSMKPLLASGDVVLINRIAYTLGTPDRFDVAVFSRGDSVLNMKRIIGLPGETVQIKENHVYINGEPLKAEGGLSLAAIAGIAEYPIELGEDEYFLLGDNRESSEDSRFAGIGNVKREQLVGKVWLKLSPLSEFGLIALPGGDS